MRRSKYQPLYEFLNPLEERERLMPFAEIEGILGFDLPPSARAHRAWWANDRRLYRQSQAWLEAGWEIKRCDLTGEAVEFVRI